MITFSHSPRGVSDIYDGRTYLGVLFPVDGHWEITSAGGRKVGAWPTREAAERAARQMWGVGGR